MDDINVVCMKWGTKYGPEYVNNLYHMVKRNLTPPFRFVCFTDKDTGIDEEVEVKPFLDFDEPFPEKTKVCVCWRKLTLFDREVYDLKGKMLFLDLDLVIIDNIDCFFAFSDKLAIPENWEQRGRLVGEGSVFSFEIGKYYHLLEKYRNDPDEVLRNHRTEQHYIPRELGVGNFDFYPDEWCRSFKLHCMPGGFLNSFMTPTKIPKNAKIIGFHGNPNPPDAIAGVWGKPVPWYKKFYKTVKPTPWIAEYWR